MVFEKLKELLIEGFDLEDEEIVSEARLAADYYMDELDFADLIMDIEDVFSIEVSEDFDLEKATLGSLVKYIEENL